MKRSFVLSLLLLSIATVEGQQKITLTLDSYLERVKNKNLEYAAELLNIDIAEARVESAKIFNDPTISAGYSNANLNGMKMGSGASIEISKAFSPGKRNASVQLAKSEADYTQMLLKDFFCNLRAQATLLWLEVIRQQRIYTVENETYNEIRKLVSVDSLRMIEGKTAKIDALQSQLEAGMLYHEVLDRKANLSNVQYQLSRFCSVNGADTIFAPASKIIRHGKIPSLSQLIESAKQNRADLLAASLMIDVSDKMYKLAKMNRRPDLEFSLGASFNNRAFNLEAPSPAHKEIGIGLSVPIPLSKSLYRGEIKETEAIMRQNKIKYENALLQIESEVVEAYNNFKTKDAQLKSYSNGLLLQAKRVLADKKEGYRNGSLPFIEVLDAQRTYDSILISYYNTFYDRTAALISLERAAGYWDLK